MRRRQPADRRVGDLERHKALQALSRAASEGRFSGSARYEEAVQQVASCRTASELDRVLLATRALVPSAVRDRLLGAIADAHSAGQLDFDEFLARSDRAHAPLSYPDAAQLVADLGVVIRAPRALRRSRRRSRRTLKLALIGGAVGGGLVALPVVVTFPGEIVSWLPVVACTGAFTAAGTAALAVAAPLRWRMITAQTTGDRPPAEGSRGAEGSPGER